MIIYKRDGKEYKLTAVWITFQDRNKPYKEYSSKSDIVEDVITLTNNSLILDHFWSNGDLMNTKIYPINEINNISVISPFVEPKD